jgi:glycerate kinase
MKVVVAMDSFKGSMRSGKADSTLAAALCERLEDAEIMVVLAAHGGEGTTGTVVRASSGELVAVKQTGPLGCAVTAHCGLLTQGGAAATEMASASGVGLIPPRRLDSIRANPSSTAKNVGRVPAVGLAMREVE